MKKLTQIIGAAVITLAYIGAASAATEASKATEAPVTTEVEAPVKAPCLEDVRLNVILAASNDASVFVHLDGTTVTLTGWVDDYFTSNAIERAAKIDGVERVINNTILR